jgi:hypothetical protein
LISDAIASARAWLPEGAIVLVLIHDDRSDGSAAVEAFRCGPVTSSDLLR